MNYNKQIDNAIERLKTNPQISKENKKLILKFLNDCFSEGLSIRRVLKYAQYLRKIALLLGKDFDKADKDDIKELAIKIDRLDTSDWTKHDYKVMLKKFYKVMEGNGEEYPDKVKWLKPRMAINKRKSPEDLLSQEEVLRMIEVQAI